MNKALLIGLSLTFALSAPAPSFSRTVRVPEEHKTIQAALESAEPGDTVLVNDGEYSENISINKTITLRSVNGPESTAVKAADKERPVFNLSDAAGINLEGFSAKGSAISGISLHRVVKSAITNNRAFHNGTGISLFFSNDNTALANSADFNANYGIYLEKSNSNRFQENSADYNGDKGIYLNTSNTNSFIRNSANINTWNGIVLMGSHYNEFRENKALRNTYGIASDSDDNVLADNTTWPNFFIILPIILIYLGIMYYLIQKFTLKFIYRE